MAFEPTTDQMSESPTIGTFYKRPASKAAVTVAQIAYTAAERAGWSITTASLVKLIAGSPWNKAHFAYGRSGPKQNYTTYGVDGPQYAKTGGAFPPLWIPTADGREPEEVFGAPAAPPPAGPSSMSFVSTKKTGPQPGIRQRSSSGGQPASMSLVAVSSAGDGTGPGGADLDSLYSSGGSFFSSESPLGISWGWVLGGGAALAAAGVIAWKLMGRGKGTRKGRRR